MDIESVLPHRYPFLFVDRVEACEPGRWARGVKNVTRNEWFMSGHFPGEPIMPGVLITEAIAQMAAFALHGADAASGSSAGKASVGMLASIAGIRFFAPVVPGDRLELYFEVLSARGPYVKGRGEAVVNGSVAASVEEIVIVTKSTRREVRHESTARCE